MSGTGPKRIQLRRKKGNRLWKNESGSEGAGNTVRSLTHSLDCGEEGLAMQATRTSKNGYPYHVLLCRRCANPGAKGQQGYCGPECRFWSKVDKAEGCWKWRGARNTAKGYGRFDAGGVRYMAHRYAYELLVGPIPAGMQLDHQCLNKMCVNPAHVEVVTEKEHGHRSGVMSGLARAGGRHA